MHRLNSDSEAENEFLKGWEVEVLNVLNRKSKLKIFINSDHQFKGIGKISLDYVKEDHSELSLQVYKRNVQAVK